MSSTCIRFVVEESKASLPGQGGWLEGFSPSTLQELLKWAQGLFSRDRQAIIDGQSQTAGLSLTTEPEQKFVLSQNVAVCGGLRRWGSSVPCCLPLVKTSKRKGLPRQRMSLCHPWRGSAELADICGAACPWLRCATKSKGFSHQN